ncbi:hypothetical protein [Cereibacter sphaeroides]|jgi:hypothetical protein|uniref:hypothetical protein n=1 Tax=Cereibacter sphaeroides TaxID=1063 RepID=UPI001192F0A8|nr:hypothetical protein [Cereibacter sphaeroides]GEM91140.1 hypothetical protein RSP03_02070 [Cereibacter sphaeroides]
MHFNAAENVQSQIPALQMPVALNTAPEARMPQNQQIVLLKRDEIFSGIRAAGVPEGSR